VGAVARAHGVIVAPHLPMELAFGSPISVCASSGSMNPRATVWFADAVTRDVRVVRRV
jgi:hypothetical protein